MVKPYRTSAYFTASVQDKKYETCLRDARERKFKYADGILYRSFRRNRVLGGVFMFFENILLFLMGCFCIWLGYKVWFKEQITLLHASRYARVKDENKKAFCRTSGFGIILIGVAAVSVILVTLITASLWGLLILFAGLAAGIAILVYADKKYNR